MADSTRIWVRTSRLDKAVYGKTRSTTKRSIPGVTEESSIVRNWGWAKGELVDNSVVSGIVDVKEIKVLIEDEESTHNRTEVVLPGEVVKDGDLVMGNVYGDGNDSDEEDGDDYGENYGSSANIGDKYPDDLITLTHLHEPSVLYSLRKRYSYDKIYTATGPILIALNPFKNCKSLFSEVEMKKYWSRGEKQMISSGIASSSGGTVEEQNEKTKKISPSTLTEEDDYLPPHVYGLADNTFRLMMNKLEEAKESSGGGRGSRTSGPEKRNNQSILVSGESGSGKTVTTKYIMQYLATLSTHADRKIVKDKERRSSFNPATGEKVSIEQQMLQSNPILESFGNARTIRNDNSSRFGKFIEIQFTSTGSLSGANIETYLLEKVRLVMQADGERNYHIFYELLQGMNDEDLDRFFLSDYSVEDFKMTNQSGTYDRRDGVEDHETYEELTTAMNTVGFSVEDKNQIFQITCAMLHASNLTFNSVSADESEIDRENPHLKDATNLLGISADALNRALCYFSITAGREKHVRSLSKEKAEKGLLALIKATYGALFTQLVRLVNESIMMDNASNRSLRNSEKSKAASIGVLDIFGFESFRFNSFEQFCINYCNETLQQQFNIFVLKNEQEEYEREGIQWSFVSFADNQEVLDLIYKKGVGIINILDDQCRAPGTTDKTFANDLYQKCSGHARFQADFRQVGARKFGVVHYAGTVEYDTDGFVEKNRDELPKEATELLLSSSNMFLKKLASILSGPEESNDIVSPKLNRSRSLRKVTGNAKSTVGSQFSKQLQELRDKIDLTSPHYVRCLKPNDDLVPDSFDPVIVADQLRCAGVIEAVRVSRIGYPQRYTHPMFVTRYRILGLKELKKGARSSHRIKPVQVLVNTIAEKIVAMDSLGASDKLNKSKDKSSKCDTVDLVSVGMQLGKTKVFLRRKAYETLERIRNRELKSAAMKLQTAGRRFIAQQSYRKSQLALLTLQNLTRRIIATNFVQIVRRNYNATLIQKVHRKWVAQKIYVVTLYICSWLQKSQRGNVGRVRFESLNKERKSIILQNIWRSYYLKKLHHLKKKSSLTLQCAIRCYFAKIVIKGLRVGAKDLQATVGERDNLRDEVKILQKKLGEALTKLSATEAAAQNSISLEKHANVNKELIKLRDELNSLQDSQKEETDKVNETVAISEKKKEEFNILQTRADKLENKVNTLTSLLKASEDDASVTEVEIKKLKDMLASVEQANINLEKEKESDAVERKHLLKQSEDLKDELEQAVLDLNTAIDSSNEVVTQTQHNIDNVTSSEFSEMRNVNEQLQDDIGLINDELSDVKTELEISRQKTKEISIEAEAFKNENNRLSTELEEKKHINANGSNNGKDEVTLLQDELVAKKEELEYLGEGISNLSKENKLIKSENKRLTKIISDNKKTDNKMPDIIGNNKSHRAFDIASSSDSSGSEDMPSPVDSFCSNIEKEKSSLSGMQVTMLFDDKKQIDQENEINQRMEPKLLQNEIQRLKKELMDTKEMTAEEILTLQDEVQCLNNELNISKTAKKSPSFDGPNNQQSEQIGQLINSVMEKDNEIRGLRQEIAMLKDQLDATYSQSSQSKSTTPLYIGGDDNRSAVGRLFSSSHRSTNGNSSEYHDVPDKHEFESLKRINDMLRKEVEDARIERDGYQMKLHEEKERAGKELEAFAVALQGVDELRIAAENMSRELTKMKEEQHMDKQVTETRKTMDEYARDDFKITEVLKRMEVANRKIDATALRTEDMNVWSKVTSGFQSFRGESGTSKETDKPPKKSRSRRRSNKRHQQSDDSVSLFSSFF